MMKKIAVCFTHNGEDIIEKLNTELIEKGLEPAEAYVLRNTEVIKKRYP